MNREELTELQARQAAGPLVAAGDLNGPDRTLAYGYTCDRVTWHTYLQAGTVHVLVYHRSGLEVVSHCARETWDARDLLPDKRLYPESVDAQFARLMVQRGAHLPFTTFCPQRYAQVASLRFHGALYDAATGAAVVSGGD